MARILMIDPYPITKEGMKRVITQHTNYEICPDSSIKDEIMSNIQRYLPDLVIMEMNLKKANAKDYIKEIKSISRNTRILIYSYQEDEKMIAGLLDSGASGYLNKSCSIEEFLKGINQILRQKKYIQDSMSSKIRMEVLQQKNEKQKVNMLTKRETDILILVANGFLNKEIANYLNITERTVKNHLSNIFKKIEVADRTQAAVFAIKSKIVEI